MAHTIRIFVDRIRDFASYVLAKDLPSKARRSFTSVLRAGFSGSQDILMRLRRLSATTKRLLTAMSILLVGLVAAILWIDPIIDLTVRPIVDFAVSKMYENVMPPDDSEMPVTVTSYPSSAHVVGIIGG